jgi:ribosome-binding protein aMBF1 (putative translation factor)
MIVFDLNCRKCGSRNTSVVLETAYMRVCEDCNHNFDIRPEEMIEEDRVYTFIY